MSNNKRYWKGEEELTQNPQFLADQKREFGDALPLDETLSDENFELNSNRRDFLKFFGFSVTAVALASCYKTNVRYAVPYLVKPEDVTPGEANYYRSTCGACAANCGIEVKVREGRPIKLDGSPDSEISNGGMCATGQASILSLYDTERLANPLMKGEEVKDWTKLDGTIKGKLAVLKATNKKVALITNSLNSPSTIAAINTFTEAYPNTQHVSFDAISFSGMMNANDADFGKRVVPHYQFQNAKAIVSFGADFLGTWLSPVEFQSQYATKRRPEVSGGMSVHVQFESNLSITGTNADHRFPMVASKELAYVATLYNYIAKELGGTQIPIPSNDELAGNAIEKSAKVLLENAGKSLVISGSNSKEIHQVVNAINMMLNNYGKTIDIINHSNQYAGNDAQMQAVFEGVKSGSIKGVIFYGVNPVFTHNKEWTAAISKADFSLSFASTKDETAVACTYVCPDNHFLESWSDSEPIKGMYHFTQPTIAPVFNTRQAQESLLSWAGALPDSSNNPFADKGILSQKLEASPYYLFIRNNWNVKLGDKFNSTLEVGYYNDEKGNTEATPSYMGNVSALASAVNKASSANGIEMVLYQSVGMRDGSQGNNPWLYELPDPVSKVCWDNYVALPKSIASKLGIEKDDTVNIELNGTKYSNVPAMIQPGQANNTIGMAVGFGHSHAGKVGGSIEKGFKPVGFNAYNFMTSDRSMVLGDVKITKGTDTYNLAQTQTHHSIEGRDIVRESTFAEWQKSPNAGNEKAATHVYTIWEKQEYRKDGSPNHLWGMAIDLNACTGCGSCVVSCSIENNVPVVGRDEIRLRREMHWIRIDRYYAFTNTQDEKFNGDDYVTRENQVDELDSSDKGNYSHWENVQVIHQPMMCQHCAQAPCETVCPVLATSHSSEGLNQMTYNRCIGTKYCGNNCPYKVRRFNWFRYNDNDAFDFHFNNPLGKMVINPDVTVRTRGVMEKCSFCVQRIQAAKLKVKREGGSMNDVEVKTACQKACPSNAIVFGDLHNPESEISKLYKNERAFSVLDELNVQSSVKYMTKIRNTQNI